MRQLLGYTFFLLLFACHSPPPVTKEKTKEEEIKTLLPDEELIISERIDGPANVRAEPNGEILFILNDNVIVDIAPEIEDWHEVFCYVEIPLEDYGMDSILVNRPLIDQKDTFGLVVKTHKVGTGTDGVNAYAALWGYIHKNNIKPYSIIENNLVEQLEDNDRSFEDWQAFIASFALEETFINYESLQTYGNYENTVEDPSPGFRMVLLFEGENLVGLLHSREIPLKQMNTTPLEEEYFVSFFEDYPIELQRGFINHMNHFVNSVD